MKPSVLKSALVFCLAAASLAAQAPPVNDDCLAAFVVVEGVNPSPPAGVSGSAYTNVGATNSTFSAEFGCASNGLNGDVFFVYTAPVTANIRVETCSPPGFAATSIADSVIAVYADAACPGGGPAIVCNDDYCGLRSTATFAAVAGSPYLIRVGSYGGTTRGTFQLTLATLAAPNDVCSNATPIPLPSATTGTVSIAGTTVGATIQPIPGIFPGAYDDVWFTLTLPQDRMVTLDCGTNFAPYIDVHTGDCSGMTLIAYGTYTVGPFLASAGQTYFIRSSVDSTALHGPFVLDVTVAPANDEPANAIQIFRGVNPAPPNGQNGLAFTNVNATDSAPPLVCFNGNKDVYFRYVAATTCPVTFAMCTPAGFTNVDFDSTMVITDELSGASVGCDDDGCQNNLSAPSNLSVLTVALTEGRSYIVRVGNWGAGGNGGTFYLTVSTTPALTIDSPNGPGSLRIANGGGPGNELYYTALTTFAGGFPNGWFYGVDISLAEVFTQLASGAPFIGILNADGGSNFALNGLPSLGVTLYGVTLIFNGNLLIGATPPVAHSI